MYVLEDRPIFLGVIKSFLVAEGLGVGLEIDNVPAILLLRENLGNGGLTPFAMLVTV